MINKETEDPDTNSAIFDSVEETNDKEETGNETEVPVTNIERDIIEDKKVQYCSLCEDSLQHFCSLCDSNCDSCDSN